MFQVNLQQTLSPHVLTTPSRHIIDVLDNNYVAQTMKESPPHKSKEYAVRKYYEICLINDEYFAFIAFLHMEVCYCFLR